MNFANNALSIGTLFGIPIRLHLSLLIAMGAVALMALSAGINLLVVPILAVSIFGSVALHELGHSLVARAKGGYIHEIVLYFFGGAAKISNLPTRPRDEIMVALAGPAVSLLLALGCQTVDWLGHVAYINWMLFGFNMLPVFPMDGGRVFRALLTIRKGRLEATRWAATLGKYFCLIFVIVGLFGIGPYPPNLLLAFIGGYIYFVGKAEYRQVLLEHQANHFSGFRDNRIEVEVSPPPYAEHGTDTGSLAEKLKNLFRR